MRTPAWLYVRRAMRLSPEQREQAAEGALKTLPPAPAARKPKHNLMTVWNAATPAEHVAFARAIGVERVWSGGIRR